RYHMYHALGLIAVAWLSGLRGPSANPPGVCMLVGIVLFSGSLYALALSGIRGLGAITPFGGIAFLVGWIWFAWVAGKVISSKRGREGPPLQRATSMGALEPDVALHGVQQKVDVERFRDDVRGSDLVRTTLRVRGGGDDYDRRARIVTFAQLCRERGS